MTIQECADKYSKQLYEQKTEECFNEIKGIIDNLTSNGLPISIELKIKIWELIKKNIEEFDKNNLKHLFEHENKGILTLISLTLKSLEKDKEK